MLFIAQIAAEYYRLMNEDMFLGVVNGEIKRVSESNATSFLRMQADSSRYLTNINVESSSNLYMGTDGSGKLNATRDGTEMAVVLDLNGSYTLVVRDKCVVSNNDGFVTGGCTNASNILYFDIVPHVGNENSSRQVTVQVNASDTQGSSFSDRLAAGATSSVKRQKNPLQPFKQRGGTVGAKRILAKFNTML